MALFVVLCTDKPDSLDLRMATRAAHLAFIESHSDRIPVGGPFLDASERMVGSMLIIEAIDRAEAESIVAEDPYAKAGLFSKVEVKPWRWVIKPPK